MKKRKKILIFRIGSLGDTIVALPAIHAIKIKHDTDDIALLLNDDGRSGERFYKQLVLEPAFVHQLFSYQSTGSSLKRFAQFTLVLLKIRLKGYNTIYYLMPSIRPLASERRDYAMFRCMLFKTIIGNRIKSDFKVDLAEPESVNLLRRTGLENLRRDDLSNRLTAAIPRHIKLDLNKKLDSFRRKSKYLYGVSPAGSHIGKRWPIENFVEVILKLAKEFNATPIIFGGPEETEFYEKIKAAVGAIPFLNQTYSLNAQLEAMRHCKVFLSNDTGSIHMASVIDIPIVGIYSNNISPQWWPASQKTTIVTAGGHCAQCPELRCTETVNPCVHKISVDGVYNAMKNYIAAE